MEGFLLAYRVITNHVSYSTYQQGNARLRFQNNGSGTAVVKQENSYYGFGLVMLNSPVSPFLWREVLSLKPNKIKKIFSLSLC